MYSSFVSFWQCLIIFVFQKYFLFNLLLWRPAGLKTSLWSWFFPSTIKWILGLELRSPGLRSKQLPLSTELCLRLPFCLLILFLWSYFSPGVQFFLVANGIQKKNQCVGPAWVSRGHILGLGCWFRCYWAGWCACPQSPDSGHTLNSCTLRIGSDLRLYSPYFLDALETVILLDKF